MSKFSFLAVISLIGCVLLFGFQALATLMGTKAVWKTLSLIKLFGPKYFQWIENISFFNLEDALMFIATMPLFALLFCLSILFFIIDKLYTK